MENFKGTKGNWTIDKRSATLFEVRSLEGKLVCEMENYERNMQIMSLYELEANAKLIATAPELLEALQHYFYVLKEARGEKWNEKPDHVLSKMLSVVKKATE